MSTTTLKIDDMHCASCYSKISGALGGIAEIEDLQFNPVRKQVLVSHAETLDAHTLIGKIEDAGFHPTLLNASSGGNATTRDLLLRLGIAGLALMQIMMAQGSLYAGMLQGMDAPLERLLEHTALLFSIPVVCYSAMPFFRTGFGNLQQGVNMDTPIALAISIAFLASLWSTLSGAGDTYYDSVAMFTFLMLGARYFDAKLRSRLAFSHSMVAALPKHAIRLRDETSAGPREKVNPADLIVGDVIWVPQGALIPADGLLIDASGTIDEALLTGERDWRERVTNENLHAGTFNRGQGFRMRVQKPLERSRLAELEAIADLAASDKHELASLADQVARWFIPIILLVSALATLVWAAIEPEKALMVGLAVLVVSCPCALSLAIPAALSAATACLRGRGILIKSSRALQTARNVGHVVFDKTGTLASPVLKVHSVLNRSAMSTRWCNSATAALQRHSSHPLASAFGDTTQIAEQVVEDPGKGLSGLVDGHEVRVGSAEYCHFNDHQSDYLGKSVFLSVDGRPAAEFELIESLRDDAEETILNLRNRGMKLELLSGDNTANCRRIAGALGIPFASGQSPERKHERLMRAQQEARNSKEALMYVGDGLNDIPALARADLSVSTLETNDLVKSRADVILLTQKLGALTELVDMGSASHRIVVQNLGWAIGYNLIAIPLAATGMLSPWLAALGMSTSSILVLLNSSRLLYGQKHSRGLS